MPGHGPHAAPPHCPNPSCDFHLDSTAWRCKRAGFYFRARPPHRVQRYRCSHCRRAFSSQTFSTTYWLKRPDLQIPLCQGEVGGAGHRQLARQHGVAHATVQRHVERIGRHCLLLQERQRPRARARLATEPVLVDGLRSFAGGQYWVLEITSLIGLRSYYSHDFVVTERRRSGTSTPVQRQKRAVYEKKLGRPDPQGLRKDVQELLWAALPEAAPVELRSDEETAYARALQRLAGRRPPVVHQTTPSTAPRTPRNPLFAVNAHHGFMRHSGSNHKRETIAFSKKVGSVILRHAVFQVWVNQVKWASERVRQTTPAQRLGVTGRPLQVRDLFGARLFPARLPLRRRVSDYYWGRVRSRFLARERGHGLKYAF